MKKKLLYLLTAFAMTGAMTACSSDDDDKDVMATFTGEDLFLSVNGTDPVGKMVVFVPGADANHAMLNLTGMPFDISALSRADMPADLTIPTPGIIPGSPEYVLNITMEKDGIGRNFSGNAATDYCTFDYSGVLYSDHNKLKMEIINVKLKNTTLAGKWSVPVLDEWTGEGNPVHFVWESGKVPAIDMFGTGMPYPMPINTIVNLALVMPTIQAGVDASGNPVMVNVPTMLSNVLKDVTFKDNGNIIATYVDAAKGAMTPSVSPEGLAQYVVTSTDSVRLYLNPQAIMATASGSRATEDATNVLVGKLLPVLMPMLPELTPIVAQGVPMAYRLEGNDLCVYLGTDFLLPLLKAVAPLFKDQEFVNALMQLMSSDPTFGAMAPMMQGVLADMPEIIEKTTVIEAGINLKRN